MASEITNIINGSFLPILGLIVYKYDDTYYIESHAIENGKMQAGVPLQEETLADIVSVYYNKQREESVLKGIVPQSVLYCNWGESNKVLVWYNEPMQRMMHFTKALHIKKGVAYQPGLIYVLEDSQLSIYAFAGNQRPNEKTEILNAPYHNVSDGSVCLGSAKSKKKIANTYESVIEHYEHLFWASEFSHLAGNESPINGNLNTLWKDAIAKKLHFKTDVLKKTGQDFKSLLKALEQ